MHGADVNWMNFPSRASSSGEIAYYLGSPKMQENMAYAGKMIHIQLMILSLKIAVAVAFGFVILAML